MLTGYWTCPYCGFENMRRFEDESRSPSAVYCDSEEGGCDGLVVLSPRVKVDFDVLRVEGGENPYKEPAIVQTEFPSEDHPMVREMRWLDGESA